MRKDNLSTKNIKDFTTNDTIYVSISKGGFTNLFYCQFLSYDPKSRRVRTKVLESTVNESIYQHQIDEGWEITAQLTKCALQGPSPEGGHSHMHWFNAYGYALDPDAELKVTENDAHIVKHPSFGTIGLTRTSGEARLFGSDVTHQHYITLKISTAENNRQHGRDYIHADKTIIEVAMSELQFSQLITSFNRGEGNPCTLIYMQGKTMPPVPEVSKIDVFEQEMSNQYHNLSVDARIAATNAMKLLKEKATINKGDRDVIYAAVEKLFRELDSNLPFMKEQFKGEMNKVVMEAKSEVEAFIQTRINDLGVQALMGGTEFPQLAISEKSSTDEGK